MTAGRFAQPTNEVLIDSRSEWSRKHIVALTTNYGRSSHFAVVRETVFPILETRPDALATLNESLIRALAGMFGLQCETVAASSLRVSGQASALPVWISQ